MERLRGLHSECLRPKKSSFGTGLDPFRLISAPVCTLPDQNRTILDPLLATFAPSASVPMRVVRLVDFSGDTQNSATATPAAKLALNTFFSPPNSGACEIKVSKLVALLVNSLLNCITDEVLLLITHFHRVLSTITLAECYPWVR